MPARRMSIGTGVQAQTNQGAASVGRPARRPFPGQKRQKGQPMSVGFQRGQLFLDAGRRIKLQGAKQPFIQITGIAQRAAQQGKVAVDTITPQPGRHRDRGTRNSYPDGRAGAQVDHKSIRRCAPAAQVAGGPVP